VQLENSFSCCDAELLQVPPILVPISSTRSESEAKEGAKSAVEQGSAWPRG